MKSFAVFLADLNDGQTLAGLTGDLTELLQTVKATGGGYLLKARLKYRLNSGTVKFWYELDRPERGVEDAFKGYVDEVRAKSGYTVLIGAAG